MHPAVPLCGIFAPVVANAKDRAIDLVEPRGASGGFNLEEFGHELFGHGEDGMIEGLFYSPLILNCFFLEPCFGGVCFLVVAIGHQHYECFSLSFFRYSSM